MLVLVVYFLLPQFSNLPGIVDQVKEANWLWFAPVLLDVGRHVHRRDVRDARLGPRTAALRTDVRRAGRGLVRGHAGAGIGRRPRAQRALPAEVGCRRRGRGAGGRASTRSPACAMHIVLLTLFVVWAGTSAFGSIHLPDPEVLALRRRRRRRARGDRVRDPGHPPRAARPAGADPQAFDQRPVRGGAAARPTSCCCSAGRWW